MKGQRDPDDNRCDHCLRRHESYAARLACEKAARETEVQRMRDEGAEAFAAGVTIEGNPHNPKYWPATHWRTGWLNAQAAQKAAA